MEDYLIREIDRIGELLLKVARKLGLFNDEVASYSVSDIKEEMNLLKLNLDMDAILAQDQLIPYLVEKERLSDSALEAFVEIMIHSDIDESKKAGLLEDAINYLDSKGYYSFRLNSLR